MRRNFEPPIEMVDDTSKRFDCYFRNFAGILRILKHVFKYNPSFLAVGYK